MAAEAFPVNPGPSWVGTPVLPDTPAAVEHQRVQEQVQSAVTGGRLPSAALTYSDSQQSMWTMPAFLKALRNHLPTNGPAMPGGFDASAGWRDGVKDDLRGAEGFTPTAYDDAAKGAAARTVGYGFNLASLVSSNAIKSALGFSDSDLAALKSGAKSIDRPQSERVLDHIVTGLGAELDAALPGVSLNGPQRRALVNLSYNSGMPALKASGVIDAVKSGDPAAVVKTLLAWAPPTNAKTGKPLEHVAARRKLAALTFLGGDADKYKSLFQ